MSKENKPCPFCGKGIYDGHENGCYFALLDLEITDKRLTSAWNARAENASQAQEIDELKAHVERLLEAVEIASDYLPKHWDMQSVPLNKIDTALAKTPAQSLAAHDAAIVDKLHIEQAQIEEEAIRNMPRKYSEPH